MHVGEGARAAVVARLGCDPFVAAERADVVLDGRELPSRGGRRRARVERRDRQGREYEWTYVDLTRYTVAQAYAAGSCFDGTAFTATARSR